MSLIKKTIEKLFFHNIELTGVERGHVYHHLEALIGRMNVSCVYAKEWHISNNIKVQYEGFDRKIYALSIGITDQREASELDLKVLNFCKEWNYSNDTRYHVRFFDFGSLDHNMTHANNATIVLANLKERLGLQ